MEKNKTRKYFKYAIGEIVLVVIGILIALSINNWNQNKIEKQVLSGYLNSISQNIHTDIEAITYLESYRFNAMSSIQYMTFNIELKDSLNLADIKFASETINNLSNLEYFNAELSGFESIKNSGYLSKLKDKKTENLIYKYYNLVEDIRIKERDYNELLREAYSAFTSSGFKNLGFFNYPESIRNNKQLNVLQTSLRKIMFNPSTQSLYNYTYTRTPELLIKYQNLLLFGKQILELISCNCDSLPTNLTKKPFNTRGKDGFSKIAVNGVTFIRFYDFGVATSDDQPIEITTNINETNFKYPESEWAITYYKIKSNSINKKSARNFSEYSSIKLELKGEKGGETIYAFLKDLDDLDDGSQTNVPLQLSNEWETYIIPISEFKTANPKELFIAAGLLSLGNAKSISVRRIEYITE